MSNITQVDKLLIVKDNTIYDVGPKVSNILATNEEYDLAISEELVPSVKQVKNDINGILLRIDTDMVTLSANDISVSSTLSGFSKDGVIGLHPTGYFGWAAGKYKEENVGEWIEFAIPDYIEDKSQILNLKFDQMPNASTRSPNRILVETIQLDDSKVSVESFVFNNGDTKELNLKNVDLTNSKAIRLTCAESFANYYGIRYVYGFLIKTSPKLIATDEEYNLAVSEKLAPSVKQVQSSLILNTEAWNIPILTGNGTPYVHEYSVYASHIHASQYQPYRVTMDFDDTDGAKWRGTSSRMPINFEFYFDKPRTVSIIRIRNEYLTDGASIVDYRVEATIDKLNWVEIVPQRTNTVMDAGAAWDIDIPEPSAYMGYRIVILTNNGYGAVSISRMHPVIETASNLPKTIRELSINNSESLEQCLLRLSTLETKVLSLEEEIRILKG